MSPKVPLPPGKFLREELQARGWTQEQLAKVIGRHQRLVSEIINAKRRVTAQTAHELGAALGTSAVYWMGLEAQYQLSRVTVDERSIRRRAARLAQQKAKLQKGGELP